jgi:dolichyl-phosphate-mannose-protein mannosyltransferase
MTGPRRAGLRLSFNSMRQERQGGRILGLATGTAAICLADAVVRAALPVTGRQASSHRRFASDLAVPIGLGLAALGLYLRRLAIPGQYSYDEVYHAYTGGQYVAGNPDAYVWDTVPPREGVAYEWTHPPLGKLLIAAGIRVFGDNALGWRAASALAGAVGVAATHQLGAEVTGRRSEGALAAGLLMTDGLYFVQSRTGVPDVFLTVFNTGSLLSAHRCLTAEPDRAGALLLATGTLLGLGLATKWSAAPTAGLIGSIVIGRAYRLWQAGLRQRFGEEPRVFGARARLRGYPGWGLAGFVLAPMAVYLAAHLPFFRSGRGWSEFVELHRQMLGYHRTIGTAPHSYYSRWWQWPLALRPIWYHVTYGVAVDADMKEPETDQVPHESDAIEYMPSEDEEATVAHVYANGNPLLYWPMTAAVVLVGVDWWGRRPAALTTLVIGYFGQWLPWAFAPRGTFVYHFLPAVPTGCLALAVLLADGWRSGFRGKMLATSYVAAVTAAFAFFYPIYAAVPITREAFERRIWWESWR